MLKRVFGALCTGIAGLILVATVFASGAVAQEKARYALLVRVLGNTAFELARVGAEEAAEELGIELIYVGPTENTAEGQIQLIDSLIAQRVDAIMITANDATALVPSLERAMRRGITVVSWDQDLASEGRSLYVGASTNALIALGPVKIVNDLIGGSGQVGIISGPANSTTQNEWVDEMVRLTKEDPQFQGIEVVEVAYGDEKSDKGYNEALGLVSKYPELEGIVAYTSIGIAASAQMVRDEGLVGKVNVTGLGFPNEMVDHVMSGAVPAFAIWNMIDLGYATTVATYRLVNDDATGAPGETIDVGRLGMLTVGENNVTILGELFVYDQSNIEEAAALIESLSK
jgi:rhamnose transport system substrate-binding protein